MPTDDRPNPEYSRDIGEFDPEVSIGSRRRQPVFRNSAARPHRQVPLECTNAYTKSRFVRRVGRTLHRSCATGRHAVRSLSLGPPRRILAVVEGYAGWISEIRNLCKTGLPKRKPHVILDGGGQIRWCPIKSTLRCAIRGCAGQALCRYFKAGQTPNSRRQVS